jgi:small GTP-binding protein
MLGSSAVGKTSLVRRFVHSVFSERYLTTMGVKIDRKPVRVDDCEVNLVLWDIHGSDEFARMFSTYLRGAAGALLVADGTRAATIATALETGQRLVSVVGEVPMVLVLIELGLTDEWEVDRRQTSSLRQQGWEVIETSAKLGTGVEDAFTGLARSMLGR